MTSTLKIAGAYFSKRQSKNDFKNYVQKEVIIIQLKPYLFPILQVLSPKLYWIDLKSRLYIFDPVGIIDKKFQAKGRVLMYTYVLFCLYAV